MIGVLSLIASIVLAWLFWVFAPSNSNAYPALAIVTCVAIAGFGLAYEQWRLMFKNYPPVVVLAAMMLAPSVADADCGQFFRQRAYSYSYTAPVVYQPTYYAQPLVYYRAGQDIEAEALAEKVARKVTEKLSALQVRQQVTATVLSAKCASCHRGDEPKGGVTLDGSLAIDDGTFRRIVEIVGGNRDVPAAMQSVVSKLTPEDKGAILDELLTLKPNDGGLE